MTLTKNELERLINDFTIEISRAKQQGKSFLAQTYNEQLKLLEMAYYDRYRR